MLPKQLDENPAGDRTYERERSEWQSYPAGRLSPSIPRAQKINAPRTTLRIKATVDPPIAEIPCSSIRCRPLAEAWIAAARRNRARWRFCSTARPAPTLWKMPTTKTRLPFFGQNLILTLTGCYRLGNIGAIQLRPQETDALRSVGIGMARRNVISKPFAYAKFFSAHMMRFSTLTRRLTLNGNKPADK